MDACPSRPVGQLGTWTVGREDEGTGLLNRQVVKRFDGSNPSLSGAETNQMMSKDMNCGKRLQARWPGVMGNGGARLNGKALDSFQIGNPMQVRILPLPNPKGGGNRCATETAARPRTATKLCA
jgi:hypothetical protein